MSDYKGSFKQLQGFSLTLDFLKYSFNVSDEGRHRTTQLEAQSLSNASRSVDLEAMVVVSPITPSESNRCVENTLRDLMRMLEHSNLPEDHKIILKNAVLESVGRKTPSTKSVDLNDVLQFINEVHAEHSDVQIVEVGTSHIGVIADDQVAVLNFKDGDKPRNGQAPKVSFDELGKFLRELGLHKVDACLQHGVPWKKPLAEFAKSELSKLSNVQARRVSSPNREVALT